MVDLQQIDVAERKVLDFTKKNKKKKRGGAPQPSVKAHPLPWSSCPRFEPDVKECYSVVAGSSLANDDRIREDPR